METLINVDFEELANRLVERMSYEEVAYKCGIAVHTLKRIADGKTKKVEHSCGQLMLALDKAD